MASAAVLLVILGYFIGSIPTGVIVAKVLGTPDPRTGGSKNIGATNVGRVAGKKAGAITLIGDVFKGAVPVFIASMVTVDPAVIGATGFFAFIGHIFPVFLGFKGGKGVATAFGVVLVISPLSAVFTAITYRVIVAVKKYVSLGSMVAASCVPAFFYFTGVKEYSPMGVAVAFIIIIKHKDNIKRLIAGTENKAS